MSAFDWRGRKVLVTGSTGFLGGWLTKALLDRGADVTVLVRDEIPRSLFRQWKLAERAAVVRGSVEDLPLCERTLNEYAIEVVFHLAAQAIVGVANRAPLSTFETNIRGTWQLLEACRRSPTVKRVVVASSDKAYGIAETLPYKESTPLAGRFPYDVSKSCADLIAQAYAATYALPVSVTRCGNLYGGGDLNFNRVIPESIRAILQGERPPIRSDGTPVREYLYVEDAVSGYLALAEQMHRKTVVGRAFNIGTDKPQTVLEVVDALIRVSGRKGLKPRILDTARHEIPEQSLDSTAAKRVLGWKPAYTLEEGLRKTFAWYQDHFKTPPAFARG